MNQKPIPAQGVEQLRGGIGSVQCAPLIAPYDGVTDDTGDDEATDMPDYRRVWVLGRAWFFTVNLLERHGNDLRTRHINSLRDAVSTVRQRRPF